LGCEKTDGSRARHPAGHSERLLIRVAWPLSKFCNAFQATPV
jgi:hypothetical protein